MGLESNPISRSRQNKNGHQKSAAELRHIDELQDRLADVLFDKWIGTLKKEERASAGKMDI